MLGGVLTAVATPFAEDGSVDLEAFARLCNHLLANGSDGLVVAGTTGEAATLTDAERLAVIEVAVAETRGRATVVAGTGTYDTAHSVHLTREATRLGVDGVLVVTPYYSKPPQRGIVAHMRTVAAATDKPVIVYNIPGRVVINIEPATMTELAGIDNVTGVKQAWPSLDEARHIVDLGLDLYAGDDDLILPFVQLGGVGGICVHTHVVGPQVQELITRAKAGDSEEAERINTSLAPAIEILRVVSNPIAIKHALSLLGVIPDRVRLPLVRVTEDESAQIEGCLGRLGLLPPRESLASAL